MQQHRLGETDLVVSRVGLGCNNFGPMLGTGMDKNEVFAVVDAAIDAGITFFDTAEGYSKGVSEEYLGEALRGRRDQVVITTKFMSGPPPTDSGSRSYILGAIDRSLERLQTDYVDLWLYHFPDRTTPIEETLGALHEVVQSGKARYVGCSNFSPEQLAEADATARAGGTTRFAAIQSKYNLLEREAEDELLPLARELGIAFVCYFSLACGTLTGKYTRGEMLPADSRLATNPGRWDHLLSEENLDRIDALKAFAQERGHSLLDLAIAGLASQPGVAGVVAGATKPEQVRANAAAAEWELDPAMLAELAII